LKKCGCVFLFYLFFFFRGVGKSYVARLPEDEVGQNQDEVGQNQDEVGQNQDEVGQNQDEVGHES
jgi:hypothetical protein